MNVLHRFRFAILALVGIGLAVGVYFALRDSTPTESEPAGALGPTPGPNSDGYVSGKRAYLEGLAKDQGASPAAALISLTGFKKPSEVATILGGGKVSAVFVRFPSSAIEALQVTNTLQAAVAERASILKRELSEELPQLEQRLRSATPDQRPDIQKLVDDRRRTVAGVSPDCSCVYAFSVEQTNVDTLATMQKRSDVRLVDVPDPLVSTLRGWQLTPLVPSS